MALDCEYDADLDTNLKLPCKVTIVNEKGLIVFDSLVNQRKPNGEKRNLKREKKIHGISSADLENAPSH